ncbi:uncharacterized protein LOC127266266 [Andrographis paniculata]|uniref:uncharacterized protein LOC127266266 n=1 Tax=Andrographis paniculata TaxID=175694 RepID=UPI0021E72C46|nr:uncharacterized protein LOC127266266 [Andrographis paniculata]
MEIWGIFQVLARGSTRGPLSPTLFVFGGGSNDYLGDFLTSFIIADDYVRITGQKINCQKSHIMFSRQCTEELRRQLREATSFGDADLPLIYFGGPFYVRYRRNTLYEGLLGKLRRYLAKWDRSVLSHGGRLQLIRSTLYSLPLYLLQVEAALPVKNDGLGIWRLTDMLRVRVTIIQYRSVCAECV